MRKGAPPLFTLPNIIQYTAIAIDRKYAFQPVDSISKLLKQRVQGQKCLNKQYAHWNEWWKAVDQIILFVQDVLCIVGYLVTSMACTYWMPIALTHCKL